MLSRVKEWAEIFYCQSSFNLETSNKSLVLGGESHSKKFAINLINFAKNID